MYVGLTEKRRQIIGEMLCCNCHEKLKIGLWLWMAMTFVKDNHILHSERRDQLDTVLKEVECLVLVWQAGVTQLISILRLWAITNFIDWYSGNVFLRN